MDPYFLDDLDQVKALLRLKEISTGGPSEIALSFAVQEARSVLYTDVGIARLAVVKSTTYSSNPSTDAEYVLSMAREAELDLIWFFLLKRMPVGVKAGTGEFLDSWNSEGAARNLSQLEVSRLRKAVWNDPVAGISIKLDFLKQDKVSPDGSRVQGSDMSETTDVNDMLYKQ